MSKIFNPLSNRAVYENGKVGKIIKEIKQWNNISKIKKIAKNFQESKVSNWEQQFLKIVNYHNPSKLQTAKILINHLKRNDTVINIPDNSMSFSEQLSNQLSNLFTQTIQHYVPYMQRVLQKSLNLENQKVISEYLSNCSITKKSCNCVICLEYTTKKYNIVRLHCNHEFHHNCISQWFTHAYTCPICKVSIQKYEPRILLDEI
jgi:hypothetical protein